MKIYTAEYNASTPTEKKVSVPLNSDYGLGVKVKVNGEEVRFKEGELKFVTDGAELSAKDVDGWQEAEFTSSSESKTKAVDVVADVSGRSNLSYEENFAGTSESMFQPAFRVTGLSVQDMSPNDIYLNWPLANDMTGLEQNYTSIAGMLNGEVPAGARTGSFSLSYANPDNPSRPQAIQVARMPDDNSKAGWFVRSTAGNYYTETIDTADFTGLSATRTFGNLIEPGQNYNVTLAWQLRQGPNCQQTFKIQVNEEEKGLMEKSLPATLSYVQLSGVYTNGSTFNTTVIAK